MWYSSYNIYTDSYYMLNKMPLYWGTPHQTRNIYKLGVLVSRLGISRILGVRTAILCVSLLKQLIIHQPICVCHYWSHRLYTNPSARVPLETTANARTDLCRSLSKTLFYTQTHLWRLLSKQLLLHKLMFLKGIKRVELFVYKPYIYSSDTSQFLLLRPHSSTPVTAKGLTFVTLLSSTSVKTQSLTPVLIQPTVLLLSHFTIRHLLHLKVWLLFRLTVRILLHTLLQFGPCYVSNVDTRYTSHFGSCYISQFDFCVTSTPVTSHSSSPVTMYSSTLVTPHSWTPREPTSRNEQKMKKELVLNDVLLSTWTYKNLKKRCHWYVVQRLK